MDSTFQSNDLHSNNTTAYFNNTSVITSDIGGNFKIYQLNVEGISAEKCKYLEKQCGELKSDVILLQETKLTGEGERSNITGYTMVASKHHKQFGIATYVKDNLLPLVQVLDPENDFYTIIKIDEETIVNVYKPPSMEFGTEVLPKFEKPFFVGGDFNSHNPLWGYNDTNRDGLNVADYMIREDLSLLFNSTDPGTFRSARWNRSYSPDLSFVSKNTDGSNQPATRKILRGFPNSQHRPIVVEIGLKLPFVRADKRNRWNFNKADWPKFAQIIDQTVFRIPTQASSYDRFVGLVKSAAVKSIPRGHRGSIIPGWSDDCRTLFDDFQITGNIETGKNLLQKLDENRKFEWESKMSTLDFAKSSKKAWSLINRMSGKSSNSKHVFPITPDQIARQIVQSSKGVVSTAQKRKVNREFKNNFRNSLLSSNFAAPFTPEDKPDANNQLDLKSRWKEWWNEVSVHNKELINDPTAEVDGFNLPRRTWLRLNRIRTGQGCCAFLLHRWNIIESPLCHCGEVQTMKHLVEECIIHRFQGTIQDIHAISSDALSWLTNLNVDI